MSAPLIWLRIGIVAALLAGGWALYHQIGVSGQLREQLRQRGDDLDAANAQVVAIEAENARQNDLIVETRYARDAALEKSQKVRTVVRTVVGASAEPCARAAVPDDVARAARAALDELWQPGAAARAGSDAAPATGAAARLPATGG